MLQLTPAARELWAKPYLPLFVHMGDAAEMARLLWRHWVARGVKKAIIDRRPEEDGERLLLLAAALHDLGKATPAFQQNKAAGTKKKVRARTGQSQEQAEAEAEADAKAIERTQECLRGLGLTCSTYIDPKKVPHWLASQVIAEKMGLARSLAIVLGGHHGLPPSDTDLDDALAYDDNLGRKDPAWIQVQAELFAYALELAGLEGAETPPLNNSAAQMALTGLVIMTDWIVSDRDLFPHSAALPDPTARAAAAWERLRLPPCWQAWDEDTLAGFDLYAERFELKANPLQKTVAAAAADLVDPGIVIIEAPMGAGKTEAALVAAELLAAKTGSGGVFFALPTQATSDGIFPRLRKWIKNITEDAHTIVLAHAKSRFNEQYQGVRVFDPHVNEGGDDNTDDNVIVHEWFKGRKKGLLADFAVGTVDQLLLAGLRRKHLALRHLGLAGKVVIVDECHAYDAYMSSYLFKALGWLGAYKAPVVVLSATLPADTRLRLLAAYLGCREMEAGSGSAAYPLITCTDGGVARQVKIPPDERQVDVELQRLDDNAIAAKLDEMLLAGGCAGIIVNTVARAQELAKELSARWGEEEVMLVHSRLLAYERARREKELRYRLGRDGQRPRRLLVVGTQVIEQSLDLDFDILFSDICPLDLLLQRLGRLHRHERLRPEKLRPARCFVLGMKDGGFVSGAEKIYGRYMLLRSAAILQLPRSLSLPRDIAPLVQSAYDFADALGLADADYKQAEAEYLQVIAKKKRTAKNFQIRDHDRQEDLVGLLDTPVSDASGKRGEAAVRDAGGSIEVIVIQQRGDGGFCTLPFLPDFGGVKIPRCGLTEELAGQVASCSLKLPPALIAPDDKTIAELERNNQCLLPPDWQNSDWLRDELFLVLDEGYAAELCGYHLTYDEKLGLIAERM